ncbi:phosphatidylserine decarboxylase 1 [Mycena galericulata]|nr:phosphatidylserine decarboxylase 1 [Mycena galericulata]
MRIIPRVLPPQQQPSAAMLFSKKSILTKGRKPLRAATRVLNASFPTASSAFARCWVHGQNKTSALLRTVRNQGFHRVYSTKGPDPNSSSNFDVDALPLYRKIINAWTETPVTWYPIPIAVGALVLVAVQYRKRTRKEVHVDADGNEVIRLKDPRPRALPLRNMSRLWGSPVWFRPYGFRIYAVAFGCNLDEIEPADLKAYPSLGAPADGTILHFGTITDLRVEQVKGITYSLDALLGVDRPGTPSIPAVHSPNMPVYSLDQLLGSSEPSTPTSESPPSSQDAPTKYGKQTDASVVEPERDLQETLRHDASVAAEMGVRPALTRTSSHAPRPGNSLFFTVIYLAPGDYHRFHSPTAWVVEKRRHFVGELFSVSPYVAKRLENLFVLNERVALLGRWKHGFFSMVPVGATNVGSIKVNFDQALRTNVRGRPPPPGTYSEAVYSAASPLLNGQPLVPAQEMGGFCLGSTIVLVFEAPQGAGQKVRVGERLGDVEKEKTE